MIAAGVLPSAVNSRWGEDTERFQILACHSYYRTPTSEGGAKTMHNVRECH